MEAVFTVESLVALLTLTILEIVLGVDNIIFLAIVTQAFPRRSSPSRDGWVSGWRSSAASSWSSASRGS